MIGVDANQHSLQRAEADCKHQIPWARDEEIYVKALNDIIEEHKVDLVTVQLESEMRTISRNRDKLSAPVFLPSLQFIEDCDDKWVSYAKWEKAGVPTPKSILIGSPADLEKAYDELGGRMWLRGLTGTGGKGSIPISPDEKQFKGMSRADILEQAEAWIKLWGDWGGFMAAELMTKETSSWESVWSHGKLIASQVRKRLYWEFSNLTRSGVTGITGASETMVDPVTEQVCRDATLALDSEPHGIIGVDVAFDSSGKPKVTEINAGRFMSGGVILFAEKSFNFPYVAAMTGLGKPVKIDGDISNPFPAGMICIRGMDLKPVITSHDEINAAEAELQGRIDRLK